MGKSISKKLYYLPTEYPAACSPRFRFGEAGGRDECGLQIINPAIGGVNKKVRRINFGIDSNRGASALALLISAAVFTAVSISLVSLKFSANNDSGSGENLFSKTSAVVLKTFANVFSPRKEKPALEINLADDLNNSAKVLEKTESDIIVETKNKNQRTENSAIGESAKNSGGEKLSQPEIKTDSALLAINENPAAVSQKPAQDTVKKIYDCSFLKTGIPNHRVIFSEVNWMGSKDSPNDEWIEIKNNSGENVQLGGWKIISSDEKIKIIFKDENKIPAGGLYLLERTDDSSAPGAAADMIYSGTLSNGGAHLKILDPLCDISDEINASEKWPAGDATARKTMERSFLDFSWHTSASAGGTPKKENSMSFAVKEPYISFAVPGGVRNNPAENSPVENQTITASSSPISSSSSDSQKIETQNQTSAHILIAEIQITGGSGKTTNDFIKIFNPSSAPFNLKEYRLVKRTKAGTSDTSLKSWTVDTLIPAGGSYLWANSSFTGLSPIPNATTTGSIADDNGVAIRQGAEDTGIIIDAVAWGNSQNSFVEGSAYPTNPGANQILSRKISGSSLQDTDNNQNDFEIR